MKHLTRLALLTTCALVSLSAALAQEYTYRLKVKEGDVFKYKLSLQVTTDEGSLTMSGQTTVKVVKVQSDGKVVCEYSEGEMTIKTSAGSAAIPAEKPFLVTYRSYGFVDKVEIPEETKPLLFFQMPFPEKPISRNESWVGLFRGNNGEPERITRMQFQGVEKLDGKEAWKVGLSDEIDAQKPPTDFHTYIWFDAQTGIPLKYEFSVNKDNASVSLKAELVR